MKSTRYEKEAVLSYRENIQEHSLAVSLAILAACDEQHYWKRKTRAEEPIIISSREREERVCGGPAGYHRWRAGCRQQIMEASHHVSTRIVRTFRFAAAGVDRVNHSTWLVDHLRSTRRPPAPLEIRSYGVPSYVESTERPPPAHRPLRTSFMEASIDADSKISAARHSWRLRSTLIVKYLQHIISSIIQLDSAWLLMSPTCRPDSMSPTLPTSCVGPTTLLTLLTNELHVEDIVPTCRRHVGVSKFRRHDIADINNKQPSSIQHVSTTSWLPRRRTDNGEITNH
jgi:hypothetical protein